MTDETSWDIDKLLDKEAGLIYQCTFCLGTTFPSTLGLPKHPKLCDNCEHVFCSECIVKYPKTAYNFK